MNRPTGVPLAVGLALGLWTSLAEAVGVTVTIKEIELNDDYLGPLPALTQYRAIVGEFFGHSTTKPGNWDEQVRVCVSDTTPPPDCERFIRNPNWVFSTDVDQTGGPVLFGFAVEDAVVDVSPWPLELSPYDEFVGLNARGLYLIIDPATRSWHVRSNPPGVSNPPGAEPGVLNPEASTGRSPVGSAEDLNGIVSFSVCVQTGLPDDVCDGVDDDCNGMADDAVPTLVACQVLGDCGYVNGTQGCDEGTPTACIPDDEYQVAPCAFSGDCGTIAGTQTCLGGIAGACVANSNVETVPCQVPGPECGMLDGTQTCIDGVKGACVPNQGASCFVALDDPLCPGYPGTLSAQDATSCLATPFNPYTAAPSRAERCISGPADPDADGDGDGLLDRWEINGVDANCDGIVDIDFQAMRDANGSPNLADPLHKDLFLEVDVMDGEEPYSLFELQQMRSAFFLAPTDAGGVPNPDGRKGINLWIDTPGIGGDILDAEPNSGGTMIPASSISRLRGVGISAVRGPLVFDACCDPSPPAGCPAPETGLLDCRFQNVRSAFFSDPCCTEAADPALCPATPACDGSLPYRDFVFRYGVRGRGGGEDPSVAEDGMLAACGNGIDDGETDDGSTDARDDECARDPFGSEDGGPLGSCSDGLDADGRDGSDADCKIDPLLQESDGNGGFAGPGSCSDGIDNNENRDGADLDDVDDCQGLPAGEQGFGPQSCFDGIDNDLNGNTDGSDAGCLGLPEEGNGGPGSCTDDIDNDDSAPGLSDWDDPACADLPKEDGDRRHSCWDGKDNGSDGVDGTDPSCGYYGGHASAGIGMLLFNPTVSTLMHETGHLLGLGHGGPWRISQRCSSDADCRAGSRCLPAKLCGPVACASNADCFALEACTSTAFGNQCLRTEANVNCKPPYVSIMNYDHSEGMVPAYDASLVELDFANLPPAPGSPATCGDGIDNTNFEMTGTDRTDPSCYPQVFEPLRDEGAPPEPGQPPTCGDDIDNDNDGSIDAADSECFDPALALFGVLPSYLDYSPPRASSGRRPAALRVAAISEAMPVETAVIDPGGELFHTMVYVDGTGLKQTVPINGYDPLAPESPTGQVLECSDRQNNDDDLHTDWSDFECQLGYDFDGNGLVTGPLAGAVNLNTQGRMGESRLCKNDDEASVLRGADDWSNIVFALGGEGAMPPLVEGPELEANPRWFAETFLSSDLAVKLEPRPEVLVTDFVAPLIVTVANSQGHTAYGALATLTLDSGLTFLELPEKCEIETSLRARCSLGNLPRGGRVDLGLEVGPDSSTGAERRVTVDVMVPGGFDTRTDNNTASTAVIAEADFELVAAEVVSAPGSLLPGQLGKVVVRQSITQYGPSRPVNADVTLTVTGPAGVTLEPSVVVRSEPAVELEQLRVGAGEFLVRCAAAGVFELNLRSEVGSSGNLYDDPNPSNNRLETSVAIHCLPCLQAGQDLLLGERSNVTSAEVASGHFFDLGNQPSIVTGDVIVDGNAFLRNGARIQGSLTLSGSLSAQSTFVVTDGTSYDSALQLVPMSSQAVVAGTSNLVVNNDDTKLWAPGTYADGFVRARGTAQLAAGVYSFRSLVVEADGTLKLDTSLGDIRLAAEQNLAFGDRAKLLVEGPGAVSFYTNSSQMVRLGTDVKFNASILAPSATIHAYSRTVIKGCLASKNVVFEPDVTLSQSASAPFPPAP